jgi:pimeloyl-ACP methyl ester carboxylesterase
VPEDCGYVSRPMAGQPVDEFVRRGFSAFAETLAAEHDPSLQRWAQWYARCQPRSIHELAGSLVQVCGDDVLVKTFTTVKRHFYVYGEHSAVDHLTPRLGRAMTRAVSGAGHFPMLDNPAEFYPLIARLLSDSGASRTAAVTGRAAASR